MTNNALSAAKIAFLKRCGDDAMVRSIRNVSPKQDYDTSFDDGQHRSPP
jgi:hypothetical protein